MRPATIGEVGHPDPARLGYPGELPEAQLRGLAGAIDDIDDERLLPNLQAQSGAVAILGGDHVAVAFRGSQRRIGGFAGESNRGALQQTAARLILQPRRKTAQTFARVKVVGDGTVLSAVAERIAVRRRDEIPTGYDSLRPGAAAESFARALGKEACPARYSPRVTDPPATRGCAVDARRI